jgi:hypothetical protein
MTWADPTVERFATRVQFVKCEEENFGLGIKLRHADCGAAPPRSHGFDRSCMHLLPFLDLFLISLLHLLALHVGPVGRSTDSRARRCQSVVLWAVRSSRDGWKMEVPSVTFLAKDLLAT